MRYNFEITTKNLEKNIYEKNNPSGEGLLSRGTRSDSNQQPTGEKFVIL